jgi:hypothetical protein
MTKKKLSIVAALVAAVAVPAVASADHDRRYESRFDERGRWTSIGEVGTHAHDAEDFVPVSNQRLESIQLTAEGRPVRLDEIKFQMADGRIVESRVQRTLHDGQSIVLDVPTDMPIKMLVLEYANRGPFYRGHEDSRLEVRGLTAARRYDRDDDRYDYRDRGDRVIVRPRPQPQPYPYVPRPAAVNPGVQIRGSVNVRF